MKNIAHILLSLSIITLILSILTKFGALTIAGVGPTGYLTATMVLLLFGANLALLDLLNKK